MPESDWQEQRRKFLKAAAAGGLVGLAGCTGGDSTATDTESDAEPGESDGTDAQTSTPARGGSLNFAQTSSPVELDPVNNNGGNYSIMLKNLVYSPVLGYDRNTNLVPILAEEVPTLEGNEFTLNLDPDARFHNGDQVTAEDVKYTFMSTIEEGTSYASNFSVVDTIDIEDDTTAHFTLTEPYVPILHAIAHQVVPKSVREEDPDAFGIDTFVG